ncbi:ATP-binding protein [Pseudomonas gingeri]|uniref:histidine kinase n=1 Tax=Pseudomonas gingeri TaxID=117681 RepID=A0A7Y7WVD5_9PSED|nr:ATP-binding protein [Pseudomonas gingeri]NWB88415.1 ATP-binding protein [Pseudomonas gingeri]
MAEKVQGLSRGHLAFKAEARLLQELGERLVAQPEVALVELIKNAYDADATTCEIGFAPGRQILSVSDNGHGMTKEEFEKRWMTIATSGKSEQRVSRKYERDLTGQKGIGRFAVRFLGAKLRVDTVAYDPLRGCKTRLVAVFDWHEIDENLSLTNTSIPFRLFKAPDDLKNGTTLSIKGLRRGGDFAQNPRFRSSVLSIVSPMSGLSRGRFTSVKSEVNQDPGFKVELPGDDDTSVVDVAKYVLDNAWASLTIDLTSDDLRYSVRFLGSDNEYSLITKYPNSIEAGMYADIRYFPRRAGLFSKKGVDGRTAYTWVKSNSGVSVVDRGFKVKPYGDEDDDWLSLGLDSSINSRDWRSSVSDIEFPMSAREKADPALSPALNLPTNYQLVGAVSVHSATGKGTRFVEDIIPSTDREGFLKTDGFEQLRDVVRGGIEYLAKIDKSRLLDEQERLAKEVTRQVKAEYKAAIEYVQSVPTLSVVEKARLVKDYSALSKKIEEVEDYDREARKKLEVMGSLGVVAGFLTHEASRIVNTVHDVSVALEEISKEHPSIAPQLELINESYDALKSHLEYTKLFVDATHSFKAVKFKSAPQILRVVQKFGKFAVDHGVEVLVNMGGEVDVPAMPITIYSGILLNLYTNALKAVLARDSSSINMKVVFSGGSNEHMHFLDVMDTGVGIPEHLAARIWDPLFTTTSRLNNPLGSGMGLGLSLVKQLVEQVNGKIALVGPQAPYSTCFRVSFPFKRDK